MTVVVNHALRQLRDGKLAIGLGLRQARTVDIAQIAKTSGFDWLFIDCEHNSMSVDTAAQIAAASLAVGITPIVRVPGYEHYHASRALDNGAQGVVVPARRHRRARAPDRRLLPLPAVRPPLDGRRAAAARLRADAGRRRRADRQRADAGRGHARVAAGHRELRGDRGGAGRSTRCSSAPTTSASRWASPGSSTTRGWRTPTRSSSPPAASTASFRGWAACTRQSCSSATSGWACGWCSRAPISRC